LLQQFGEKSLNLCRFVALSLSDFRFPCHSVSHFHTGIASIRMPVKNIVAVFLYRQWARLQGYPADKFLLPQNDLLDNVFIHIPAVF